MRYVLAIEAISKKKLKNFLLDLNFKAERLPCSPEEELINKGELEVIEKIFEGIDSGRFDL